VSDFVGWVTHGIKRGRFTWNRRQIGYALALAAAAVLVGALYLTVVSHNAAQGRHIQSLRADLSALERENAQLEVLVASTGAFANLSQRAAALGLVPAEHVEFLRAAEP